MLFFRMKNSVENIYKFLRYITRLDNNGCTKNKEKKKIDQGNKISSKIEVLLELVGDVFCYRHTARRRWRRGIPAVHHSTPDASNAVIEHEVVDQFSIVIHCLSSHARRTSAGSKRKVNELIETNVVRINFRPDKS